MCCCQPHLLGLSQANVYSARYIKTRITVASQQTLREWWTEQGFTPYNTIRQSAEVPEIFRKRSQWRNDPGAAIGYYSYESEPGLFIPVEFDSENYCWVEIFWITYQKPASKQITGRHFIRHVMLGTLGTYLGCDVLSKQYYITDSLGLSFETPG